MLSEFIIEIVQIATQAVFLPLFFVFGRRYLGIQVENKHRQVLQEALDNVTRHLVNKYGPERKPPNHEVIEYLYKNVPEAVRYFVERPGFNLDSVIEARLSR